MIHYHGTPMTPTHDMVKAFAGKHAMVSFAHPEQIEVCAEICQSVVLDNGAFSAWKSGVKYDFDGYLKWALDWLYHPAVEWCVIPDVIDGDERQNDALIAAWPLSRVMSVPVWHMHESLSRLERLMRFPRVALGSSGRYATIGSVDWWEKMAAAMDILCDDEGRPRTKIHGLRMLDPGVFSKLPLASADSTNVARNVGLDVRWKGTYISKSRAVRALILMERIERHASASRWNRECIDAYQNMDLLG
jgi:hypothetical protein